MSRDQTKTDQLAPAHLDGLTIAQLSSNVTRLSQASNDGFSTMKIKTTIEIEFEANEG
jgi:hypothetical protein